MSNIDKVEKMSIRAYDMFPNKHEADKHVENPFPMFSYEIAATTFWQAMIEEMFDRGLNEKEVEWLLRSKHMRWMLDGADDKFKALAKTLVTDSMLGSAKSAKKEA